jgi:hypothetical protein
MRAGTLVLSASGSMAMPPLLHAASSSFLISAGKGYGDCWLDAYAVLRIRLVPARTTADPGRATFLPVVSSAR